MMSKTNYDKVREFHLAMGQPLDEEWKLGDLDCLRLNLLEEEFNEVEEAVTKENLLKELCDLLYVVYGYAATFGWDIDTAFNRVHASNMSKLGEDGKPIFREDGKVLKGPNYKAPSMEGLV